MVALTLRRPTAEEYSAWTAATLAEYADDIVASGAMSRDDADKKAREDDAQMLPQGLDTPRHFIFRVEEDERPVGWLWYGLDKPHNPRPGVGFIYDISIDEPLRGRGYGRALMQLAEQQARANGLRGLALHVFGKNSVARSLYRSLGYREVSVQMQKDL